MAENKGEFIDILSPSALSDLAKGIKSTKELVKEINKALDAQGKLNNNGKSPSASASNTSSNNSSTATANKLASENARLTQRLADLKKAEALENAKLRVEIENLNKQQKQAAKEALGVLTSYQKLSAELNELRGEAKAVAADMFNLEQAGEKNSDQYKELAATYARLSQRVGVLHSGLTGIDRSLGDHRREVGNYENAWNGLGNAINQLTREAPAFAVSISTGFLAISNNIPTLVDELGQLTRRNNELRAQGQPTVSVLRQFATSLFSWQTALSAGVTLLTIYGAKIIDFAFGVQKATRQIDQLQAAQERYNDTVVEVTTNSERELTALNRRVAVAQDVTKSDKERAAASKELISQYPGYLDGLTEEQIRLGYSAKNNKEYAKQIQSLTADIQKRVEAEAKQGANRESLKIAAELEQEAKVRERVNKAAQDYYNKYGDDSAYAKSSVDALRRQVKARQELLKEDQTFIEKFGELGVSETGRVDMLGLYEPAQITELQKRAQELRREVAKQNGEINQTFKDTSLLDMKAEKDANNLQYENLVDYYASRYELIRTQLENEANAQKLIIDDEAKSLEHRNAANEEYHKIQLALATEAYAEQKRLLDKNLADEVASLQKRVKDGEIAEKNANGVIYTLRRQYHFDLLKAEEDNSEAIKNVNRSLAESLKGVWQEMDLKKQTNLIDERELENTRSYVAELKNIVEGNEDYQKILAAEKELNEANVGLTQERLQAEERAIEAELAAFPERERNSQAYLELQNKLVAKTKERAEVDKKSAEEQAAAMAKLQKATEDYVKSISSGSLSDFGFKSLDIFTKLDENGKSTFKNLIDGANNTGEKIGVIFKAISDVAKDAIDFLAQNQQAKFDAQYAALEKQYELDQEFNAKGEEAKAELQKQYDERRREIRIKEAKAEKENAIFKAIINTAQGVTSALATANIPLSIIIAALGAAQVASIAGRQIPAYEFGTANHPGGAAIVGDGGRAELIHQPSRGWSVSPSVPTLMNLERGSVVLPDANAYRREIPAYMGSGGVNIDYDRLGAAVGNQIPELTSIELTKSGFNSYVIRGSARSKKFDDRISSSGKKFS